MANPAKDIYVEVGNMSSEETEADPKLKKEMPGVMKAAAEDLIKKTKGITSTKPKDKKAKAYAISGTLTKLKKEPKGKEALLSCAVNMVLTEWPSGKMVTGRLDGSAKTKVPADQSEKQLRGDADACVAAAVSGAIETALNYILSADK
jgi:hypothetical protein